MSKAFLADYAYCLALSDARKRENEAARAACKKNLPLCAYLTAEAVRRGQREIDWAEYFRNVGLS